MAQLKGQATTTHRVYLPSTQKETNEDDRVYVDIKDSLTVADKLDVATGRTVGDKLLAGVTSMIVSWNFTRDGTSKSQMIPITQDVVEREFTNDEDLKVLFEEYTKLVDIANAESGIDTEEKKTSSDTLAPDTQELVTPSETIQV